VLTKVRHAHVLECSNLVVQSGGFRAGTYVLIGLHWSQNEGGLSVTVAIPRLLKVNGDKALTKDENPNRVRDLGDLRKFLHSLYRSMI
jgi:hypothetical protein